VAVGGSHRSPFAAARSIGYWGWDNRNYIYGEIALSGGDPGKLTLRTFIQAAYALMVRTYAGIPGKNLLEAIDLANESFGIEQNKNEPVETQNEQSLKQLETALMGVRR
jgi:hypothetical protein